VKASTTSFLTRNASTNLSCRALISASGGAGDTFSQNFPFVCRLLMSEAGALAAGRVNVANSVAKTAEARMVMFEWGFVPVLWRTLREEGDVQKGKSTYLGYIFHISA